MKMYDYIIVGAGLTGCVFANLLHQSGKKVLVLERRNHIGGLCYSKKMNNIETHWYGAHIFHTSDKQVWDYVNSFVSFNHYINSPVANYQGRLFNLPFNMSTFHQLWGVITPKEAIAKLKEQTKPYQDIEPQNLEEQALKLAGPDIYYTLIKGYSEKQWGKPAAGIPAFVIKRLPFRFRYDNNYYNDCYQGIPIGGYTCLFQKMLTGIEVKTGIDYLHDIEYWNHQGEHVLYTGPIDELCGYEKGYLEYRSLRFEHEYLPDCNNYQGVAVCNYTEKEIPYTRIIEHQHFEFREGPGTVITREYPVTWECGKECYYPINDLKNQKLYDCYRKVVYEKYPALTLAGRLAEYKYYDMDQVIKNIIKLKRKETAK